MNREQIRGFIRKMYLAALLNLLLGVAVVLVPAIRSSFGIDDEMRLILGLIFGAGTVTPLTLVWRFRKQVRTALPNEEL